LDNANVGIYFTQELGEYTNFGVFAFLTYQGS